MSHRITKEKIQKSCAGIILIYSFFLIFLITSCAPLKQSAFFLKPTTTSIIPEKDTPQIELFVMSQCPYAVEAEKAVIPVIKGLKDEVDFSLYYIAGEGSEHMMQPPAQNSIESSGEIEEQGMYTCRGEAVSEGGPFRSLHGQSEIDENIRQVVMAKYYPQKYLDYLLLRAENYASDNWEECAAKAWMDCKFISRIARSEEGKDLFRRNIKKALEVGVEASPTLLINGRRYKRNITQLGINRMVCRQGRIYELCKSTPVCGSDADCSAEGKVGVCLDPDTPQADCRFNEPIPFEVVVINPPYEFRVCKADEVVKIIQGLFPKVKIRELDNNAAEAKKYINDLNIKALPAVYFDKKVAQAARYNKIKARLLKAKDGFLLDPQYINIAYLLEREEKKGDIKLFVESMSPRAIITEDFLINDGFLQEAGVDIHYLAGKIDPEDAHKIITLKGKGEKSKTLQLSPRPGNVIFKSPKGLREIQEDIRQLCISKYYPAEYHGYLLCINRNLGKDEGTVDWRQCFSKGETDYQKIYACTRGREGRDLLLRDIALNEELKVTHSPAYLVDNKILLKGIDPLGFKKIYSELTSSAK